MKPIKSGFSNNLLHTTKTMPGTIAKLSMHDVAQVWRTRGFTRGAAALEKSSKVIPGKHVEAIEHALGAIVSTGGESALDILARDFSDYVRKSHVPAKKLRNGVALAETRTNWRANFDARRKKSGRDAGVRAASDAWKVVYSYAVEQTLGVKSMDEASAIVESIEIEAFQRMAERADTLGTLPKSPRSTALVPIDFFKFKQHHMTHSPKKHTVAEKVVATLSKSKVSNKTIQQVASLLVIAAILMYYRHVKKSQREGNETAFGKIKRVFKRLVRRLTHQTENVDPPIHVSPKAWPRRKPSKRPRCTARARRLTS